MRIINRFLVLALACAGTLQAGERHGINPDFFDKTCEPCKDFYRHTSGEWIDNKEIPAEYSSWGMFHQVYEGNLKTLKEIATESAADTKAKPGSTRQKVGDFYFSGMDEEKIEADGHAPIAKDLKRVDNLKDINEMAELLTYYHGMGSSYLFPFFVMQDLENSEIQIAYSGQGGLGLPDRDYYLKEDEDSLKLRKQYQEHVAKMLVLIGDSEEAAAKNAQRIMDLETRLAKASFTKVEMRDPQRWYNMVTLDEANKITPLFDWKTYVKGLNVPVTSFSMSSPQFFEEINALLKDRSMDDWKAYLRWHMVNEAAPYLSSKFVDTNFAFKGVILTGAKELQPRWKRVLGVTGSNLGEALGQLYVAKAFPPESKARCLEMINNLRASLKIRLENLDWMSAETKKKALHKLSTFTPKIGYPDKWRDYTDYKITRDSYFANVRRGSAFETRRELAKIGKPVDRTEWGMPPQTVNAYYNSLKNEIVFPAGILQPPFFDGKADDASNYGAIGAVIGHELLHGFDDKGSQFDADGNMSNWWTDEDRTKFEQRTSKLVDQFNNYKVLDGTIAVNGELTLGENIADLGGIVVAYEALLKSLEGKPQTKIDGLTQQERFFVAWAQAWRTKYRPEYLKLMINTDTHSPANYRANGPLSNLDYFREVFKCKDDDKMVRTGEKQVKVW